MPKTITTPIDGHDWKKAFLEKSAQCREIDRRLCELVHFIRGTESKKSERRNPILEAIPDATEN